MADYDAIVVGGGPAGSTCAYRLASAGASVLLLDRAVDRFPKLSFTIAKTQFWRLVTRMMLGEYGRP